MTEILIATTLVVGLTTAEVQLLRKVQAAYASLDDEQNEQLLPPRLDHAAPGQGRTPRAFCLILERAAVSSAAVGEAPCT